jgi:hypothetical protein
MYIFILDFKCIKGSVDQITENKLQRFRFIEYRSSLLHLKTTCILCKLAITLFMVFALLDSYLNT